MTSANTKQLMIFGGIIAVYSENHTKYINNSEQNVKSSYMKSIHTTVTPVLQRGKGQ